MRPDYVRRFHEMVEELRRSPDIALARVHVAPPVSEETIARVHETLGFTLADRIVDFYRQANGLALEWIPRAHSAFDPTSHAREQDGPFDMIPQEVSGGVINIYPFESLLDDYEDVFWFRTMEGETLELDGEQHDLLAFSRSLRPLDYYSEASMAAFVLHGHPAEPPVRIGSDYGATFTRHRPIDFVAYLEGVLALHGSGVFRERFFGQWDGTLPDSPEAWRELAPSLDELIAASLERDTESDGDMLLGDDFDDFDTELDDDADEELDDFEESDFDELDD